MNGLVQEPDGGFDSWQDEQDFDYHRTESAVIDYINGCIDYEKLDAAIESGEEIEFDGVFDDLDEEEFAAAEEHITAYINAQVE